MPSRLWFIGFLALAIFPAASASEAGAAEPIPTIKLPDVPVIGERPPDLPLFDKTELVAPDFSPKCGPIDAQFPGHAYYDGISEGTATVGVMLDREGRATDFLLIRCTKSYFGDSLMRAAHRELYTPRRVMGVPVPGRFNFTYAFRPMTKVVTMSSFDAITQRDEEIGGGPKFIYAPHRESELDHRQLEPVRVQVPAIPANYAAHDGKAPKVLLTFYVDENGQVRLPNVESAPSSALVAGAIEAILHWEFKPPTIKGQAVLVYTARVFTFREK